MRLKLKTFFKKRDSPFVHPICTFLLTLAPLLEEIGRKTIFLKSQMTVCHVTKYKKSYKDMQQSVHQA